MDSIAIELFDHNEWRHKKTGAVLYLQFRDNMQLERQ